MKLCDRCGRWVDEDDGGVINEELGYANCGRCEEEYQEALRQQYPHGQCQECGAKYFPHTRRDGTQEYRAWHAEGGCSQWRDWVDEDAYEDLAAEEAQEAEADGRVDPNPVYEDSPSRIPGPKVDPAWVHQDGQGLVLDDDLPF